MEIIRSVDIQHGKIRIIFDSGWTVWLSEKWNPCFPLQEGTVVDPEEFRKFILLRQYPPALNKAVAMLAARPCSRNEIESRLLRNRYDREVIEMVLCKLDLNNLIDDREFSDQWVESRMKKYGSRRIRQELRQKGIEEDIVQESLEIISDEEEMKNAVLTAAKKIRSSCNRNQPEKLFTQVIGMLLRRGYSRDTAVKAFYEAIKETE